MIKKLLLIVLILALLAIGAVAYLILTLDPAELGQKLIRRINQSGTVQMQAESFEISPLKGLYLQNARVEGALASGRMSAGVARIVVDYRLLPILQGEVVVDQIVIEQPRILLVSSAVDPEAEASRGRGSGKRRTADRDAGSQADSQSEPGSKPSVTITAFRIEDGSAVFRVEGDESSETVISGIDLRLKDFRLDSSVADPLLGLAAAGSIEIDRISDGERTILGSRGRITIDRGQVAITELGVETDHAELEVSQLELDLREQPPPYTMTLGGEYDLDSVVEAEGSDSFGPASIQMSLAGAGPGLDQMQGDGVLRLESGSIPPFRMVSLIERLLGEPLITGKSYEATTIEFTISQNLVRIEPFTLTLEEMRISGEGQVDLAGPVDLGLALELPREQVDIDGIEGAIDGLTEDGWTTLPFNVGGTLEEPDVSIDSSLYKDAALGMGKKAVGGLLDKIFDKDDSN